MTDRIKPYEIDHAKALEQRARLKDITDRAKAASGVVDVGRDRLDTPRPVDGMDERFGFAADSDYLK